MTLPSESLSLSKMIPNQIENKRILFSPLNWGLGHVSRSIGLIHFLQREDNTIIIACNEKQRKVYECYFNEMLFIEHEGYPFQFGGKGRFGWDLIKKSSKLKARLEKERKETEQYVRDYEIDIVISDHRYGFRSPRKPSVFVTHQYNLPLRWYERAINKMHHRLMLRFDQIWIMDYYDSRLAGELSQCGDRTKVKYIGPYSRFKMYNRVEKDIDEVLIASGPHVYAQQMVDRFAENKKGILVICEDEIKLPETAVRVRGSWKEQDAIVLRAKKIISRSGYSTIMDIEYLDSDSELYPTPGQSEQIYLAKKHAQ